MRGPLVGALKRWFTSPCGCCRWGSHRWRSFSDHCAHVGVFKEAEVPESSEVAKTKAVPSEKDLTVIYLDSFDQLRRLDKRCHQALEGMPSDRHDRFLKVCKEKGLPLNEAKRLVAEGERARGRARWRSWDLRQTKCVASSASVVLCWGLMHGLNGCCTTLWGRPRSACAFAGHFLQFSTGSLMKHKSGPTAGVPFRRKRDTPVLLLAGPASARRGQGSTPRVSAESVAAPQVW